MSLFTTLDHLKADLDALRPLTPEQEQRVLQKFRLEWNYNSNAIEGNSLTLGETRSLLLHGVAASGKSMRDHDDIRNHNKAIAEVELLATETRPITEHLIREMHEILLGREPYYVEAKTDTGLPTRQLIQPGTYKRNPNQTVTATGEHIYFASPEETPARMADLLDWYRQEEDIPVLPPVFLAADFHHRFVRIHPFDDGNGRMSRLLMNLILLRHGYPMTVIQAADRNRYLAVLAEADAGDFDPFLKFIIDNVEAGLRLMIRAAKGESIDEPDDLDKRLALLKKQVASREEFARATWNVETQRHFYESFLTPWIGNIWLTLNKFNDLFLQTIVRIEVRDSNNRHVNDNQNVSLGEFMYTIEQVIDRGDLIGEVAVRFTWHDFRNIGNSFHQSASFTWKFEKLKYRVLFALSPNGYSHESDAGYYQAYNLDEAKKEVRKLADSALDFIAAKVAEADSAPS